MFTERLPCWGYGLPSTHNISTQEPVVLMSPTILFANGGPIFEFTRNNLPDLGLRVPREDQIQQFFPAANCIGFPIGAQGTARSKVSSLAVDNPVI